LNGEAFTETEIKSSMDRNNPSQPDNPGKPKDPEETRRAENNPAIGKPKDNGATGSRRELLRYAGLSSEVFVSVGLSIFIGIKADKWTAVSFPIFSWALPLLVIVVLIVKLVKETSGNKDGK
jgi:hypothetical protein